MGRGALLVAVLLLVPVAPAAQAEVHRKAFVVGKREIAWKSRTVFPRRNPDIVYALRSGRAGFFIESRGDCRLIFYGAFATFRVNSCGQRIRVRAQRLGPRRRYVLMMRF